MYVDVEAFPQCSSSSSRTGFVQLTYEHRVGCIACQCDTATMVIPRYRRPRLHLIDANMAVFWRPVNRRLKDIAEGNSVMPDIVERLLATEVDGFATPYFDPKGRPSGFVACIISRQYCRLRNSTYY